MKVLSDVNTTFDVKAKIRTWIVKWDSSTSKDKFLFLYNIPKNMFEMVGVRVYGDCELNWYSHLGNFMIAYYLSMTSYTLYYWSEKGQFLHGTRCLCGMGIMISVIR